MEQDSLLEYTPTQTEEIERLMKLAAEKNARVEALVNEPVFIKAKENAKLLDKKIKEIEKLRSDLRNIAVQVAILDLVKVEEPTEDGYYIFTKKDTGYRGGSLRVSKCLLLKGLGEWFNLSEEGNTLPGWNGKHTSFNDFLDIDGDCIEATIQRFEGTLWPVDLLKENGNEESIADEFLNSEDEEGEE